MGYFTGRTGKLYLGTVFSANTEPKPQTSEAVLKIRDWSLDTNLELLEISSIDSGVKTYTPGMSSATGSATVLYYRKEANDTGIQFTDLLNKVMKTDGAWTNTSTTTTASVTASDMVSMILRVGESQTITGGVVTDYKDDIAFYAYITSASLKVGTGELSSVGIQFTVNGPFRTIPSA